MMQIDNPLRHGYQGSGRPEHLRLHPRRQRPTDSGSGNSRHAQFTLDDQRQLTSAYWFDGNGQPLPNYIFPYTFDPIGNWRKTTSNAGETDITANNLNQYLQVKTTENTLTPQYDANGNMLADNQGNTYRYDEEDRLIEADRPVVPKHTDSCAD